MNFKKFVWLVIFVWPGSGFGQDASVSLQPKWISEAVFQVPESVYYDAPRNMVYVANINGASDAKDGNGFISRISPDGKIINLQWIIGLNAPKGMGVFEGRLFVTDIDQVVEIDILAGKILQKYPAKEAQFLNDITVAPDGRVFVSDMRAHRIYLLSHGKIEPWLTDEAIVRPNGLFFQENHLLIGCGKVLKVNPVTLKIELFIPETGSIDGLVAAGVRQYLISDWTGHIYWIEPDKPKILLLDLTTQKMNAADIDYVPGKKLLLIPTFSANRVAAYELVQK